MSRMEEYDRSREISRREYICHAPFNNLYFNVLGQASPCWLTLEHGGRYPDQSILEIWKGARLEGFRSRIRRRDLSGPCHVCERNISNGVFKTTLARAYDNEYPLGAFPTIMEFELSNTCNLECVMCKGLLSSTIRRDRDFLPPFKTPYDSSFVEQLEEFIPHLREARFNGGEPLLQKICWDIWDRIAEINPAIEITLATNGTGLNKRAKHLLERCRVKVNVSIDSLEKENYERIRKNAVLESTLENTRWYAELTRRSGTSLCVMVNPMRLNWHELPEFVRFCSKNAYYLWFNTIWRPARLALWNLESSQLQSIHSLLSRAEERLSRNPIESPTFQANLLVLRNFVHGQLDTWIRDQRLRESERRDHLTLQGKRAGAKTEFFRRVREHLPDTMAGRRHLEELTRKLDLLEKRVSANVPSGDYYHHLASSPLPMVLEDLKTKSVEHLTEWIYRHDGYY